MRFPLITVLCLGTAALFGQDTTPKPENSPEKPAETVTTAPAPSHFSTHGIDFFGVFDGYASYNSNHPTNGRNSFRAFDVTSNGWDLSMAKLAVEHLPDPLGFRVEVGFGRAFDVFHSLANTEPDPMRHVIQAYASLKPKQTKGLQIDFGKFYTSAGAEVVDNQNNWNYTRSLLFYSGPYFHFGLRTQMPVGKHFVGGVQVVQGINNVLDNNGGKTLGFTGNFTWSKLTWANTYYVGPEKNDITRGKRNFYDTVVTVTPNARTAFAVNFDYNRENNIDKGFVSYYGVAAAARFALTKKLAFSPRVEWLKDADGFGTLYPQTIKEATLTGEYKFFDGLLTRLEYRHDSSDSRWFDRRDGAPGKSQNTVALGMVAYFGPKR